MKRGDNQYAPMQGIVELRERIAEKMQEQYGRAHDADKEITVTAGGTQAIYVAITAMVQPRSRKTNERNKQKNSAQLA